MDVNTYGDIKNFANQNENDARLKEGEIGRMITEHIPDNCTHRDNKKAFLGTMNVTDDNGLFLVFGYEKSLLEPEKDMKKIGFWNKWFHV